MTWYLEAFDPVSDRLVSEHRLPGVTDLAMGQALGNPPDLIGSTFALTNAVRELIEGVLPDGALDGALDNFVVMCAD